MIDTKKIRLDFPILQNKVYGKPLIYLDNAATTQKPQPVLDRIVDFYTNSNSNIHRGVHYLSSRSSLLYEEARQRVGKFIRSPRSSQIIFTGGTTESVNLLSFSFGEAFISEGDEIIVSEMEHHSNILPWQFLCRRKGAVLKVIPINDDGVLDMGIFPSLISKKTKLVSVTYVSNVLGTINPVDKIIEISHSENIPVLIDGAQAIQHLPVDVQALDCDFFVFSGHKIYGPTGIGVLYGKEKWLEKIPPYQTGGGMIDNVSFRDTKVTEIPLKFEAGTMNYVGASALSAAMDYLEDIGLENIQNHENILINYALEKLRGIKGISIYGNAPYRCGAVSFNLNGVHPYDAGMVLDKLGIAIRTGTHCAEPVMDHFGISGTIRASFGVYNNLTDIDSLIWGLEKAEKMLT